MLMTQGCATFTTVRHPEFSSRHPRIGSIAILPPMVEVYRITFQGDRQPLYDLLPSVQRQVMEEAQRVLSNRGYHTRMLETSEEESPSDGKIPRAHFHTAYQLFEQRIQKHRKRFFPAFREFRYSIGSEANVFAEHEESDALLLMQCMAYQKTAGQIAEEVVKSVLMAAATLGSVVTYQYPSTTFLEIGIVDGETGDVLWYVDNNHAGAFAFNITREKQLRRAVKSLLSKFPKASRAVQGSPLHASRE